MYKQFLSIFIVTFVGGCAPQISSPAFQSKTPQQKIAIKDAYEKCVARNAVKLDDGYSPANVIGASVETACHAEFVANAMLIVEDDNDAVKRQFYHRLPELEGRAPTTYVLSRRAYLNKR